MYGKLVWKGFILLCIEGRGQERQVSSKDQKPHYIVLEKVNDSRYEIEDTRNNRNMMKG